MYVVVTPPILALGAPCLPGAIVRQSMVREETGGPPGNNLKNPHATNPGFTVKVGLSRGRMKSVEVETPLL